MIGKNFRMPDWKDTCDCGSCSRPYSPLQVSRTNDCFVFEVEFQGSQIRSMLSAMPNSWCFWGQPQWSKRKQMSFNCNYLGSRAQRTSEDEWANCGPWAIPHNPSICCSNPPRTPTESLVSHLVYGLLGLCIQRTLRKLTSLYDTR